MTKDMTQGSPLKLLLAFAVPLMLGSLFQPVSYTHLRTSTSCPNISDWMAAYEGADEVYVVTITGTLSGAYNAALLAGEE